MLVRITGSLVVAAGIASLTLISSGSAKAFTGTGTGTSNDPYLISSCADLQSVGEDSVSGLTDNKTYKLSGDINCAATSGWNSGAGFNPIDYFNGVFDGDNHTISNLVINRPSENQVGLFGQTSNDSLIVRVNLTNVDITGRNNVGGLAGEMNSTSAGNSVTGSVTGATTNYYYGVGGLFGRKGQGEASISRSSFTGTITNTGPSTGGLIGYGGNIGIVSNVYADATVNGQNNVGGLIGMVNACCNQLSNAYAIGSVTGNSYVGGLYGVYADANSDNYMSNAFSAVEVTGTSQVGAVFGDIDDIDPTPITNVMFDATVAGTTDCYGSSNASNLSCTAQNTDGEDSDYFYTNANQPVASWNTTNVWTAHANDYPTLQSIAVLTGPSEVSNIEVTFPDQPNLALVSFDASADSGSFPIKEYEGEIKLASSDWDTVIDNDSENEPGFEFGNLSLDTDYTIRVRAITVYGQSDWVEYSFTSGVAETHSVATCQELQDLSDNASYLDTILLTQDIDCSDIDNFSPLSWDYDFGGTFDGQGHTISNLTIDNDESTGLFAYTQNATIQNLTLSGGSITAEYGYAGALVGELTNTDLSNIHSDLDVTAEDGSYVGGLVGYAESDESSRDITFDNISSSGTITGTYGVGGVIGKLENYQSPTITISRSYSTGDVTYAYDTPWNNSFGGLIGSIEVDAYDDDLISSVDIQDSYTTGNVQGTSAAGGLIGYIEVDSDGYDNSSANIRIERTYAAGDVSTLYDNAGGLIGEIDDIDYESDSITLNDNFSAGAVTAPEDYQYGAFVGNYEEYDYAVSSSNNRYDNSSTENCEGDLYSSPLPNCEGVDEVDQPDYFKNNSTNVPLDQWDFEDVWETKTDDYPKLRVSIEQDTADLNGDNIADSEQPQLSGYTSPITGKKVVIDTGEGCEITTDDIDRESSLAVQDPAYEYANGLFDFAADCEGSSTTIKLYYYDVSIADLTVRKYNPHTHAYFTIPGASLSQQTINGHSVAVATYEIIDGGTLDMDGEVNGSIEDPAGIASLVVGAPNTGIGGRR